MYNIVIGIPTYKRPEMLKKLIFSIIDSNIDTSIINDLNVLVIDNDIDRSSEVVVKEIVGKLSFIHKLIYFNYPVKGLSNVRNELFAQALKFNPDYIVCLDDDEFATTDWLNQLLLTITANNGDIAVGPVIPVFESNISPYISCWFKYHDLPNNIKTEVFETNNFIISTRFLLKHNLKFDMRFNTTGAEDSYFRLAVLKKDAKIYWAAKAIAYETIPEVRAKLLWLIKRNYRGAITYTYILKLEKEYFKILRKCLVNIAYFLSGSIALIAIPFPFKHKYWGIFKVSESIGGFAGLYGIKYHEYAKGR
jgi:succinoglycan biosynthesis protein ExoM